MYDKFQQCFQDTVFHYCLWKTLAILHHLILENNLTVSRLIIDFNTKWSQVQEFVHQSAICSYHPYFDKVGFSGFSGLPWMTTGFICVVGGSLGSETISTAKGRACRLGWVHPERICSMEREKYPKISTTIGTGCGKWWKYCWKIMEIVSGYRWNFNGFVTLQNNVFSTVAIQVD